MTLESSNLYNLSFYPGLSFLTYKREQRDFFSDKLLNYLKPWNEIFAAWNFRDILKAQFFQEFFSRFSLSTHFNLDV